MKTMLLPFGAMSLEPASSGGAVSRRWLRPFAFMLRIAAT